MLYHLVKCRQIYQIEVVKTMAVCVISCLFDESHLSDIRCVELALYSFVQEMD